MNATHSYGCTRGSYQICLGCGAHVCACRGTARGQCPVCYAGMLSGFYPMRGRPCGYKHCTRPGTVAVPRVKVACREHARERAGYAPNLAGHECDAAPNARMTPYTATLRDARPDFFPN